MVQDNGDRGAPATAVCNNSSDPPGKIDQSQAQQLLGCCCCPSPEQLVMHPRDRWHMPGGCCACQQLAWPAQTGAKQTQHVRTTELSRVTGCARGPRASTCSPACDMLLECQNPKFQVAKFQALAFVCSFSLSRNQLAAGIHIYVLSGMREHGSK